ncbi:DMT family transporter [Mycobacterium sp. 360MFTsu5.1]|uniref:DMT family transporter n=1 Tax=Mycobacterium sp. 360MFTsu5.1 TaxID=1172186 RepID=UPI00037D65E6|nr:DMT family transporter [Mycobacterium sp. 360MFTsu5.1]
MSPNLTRHLGLLQISAASVLWGTGGLVVTVIHDRSGLGAMTASAWRMALATVALVTFIAVTGLAGQAITMMRSRPVVPIVVGCGTALYQGLYFASVLSIGVAVATVVALGLSPILASIWQHIQARTAPSLREIAVLAAALVGLCLVTFGGAPLERGGGATNFTAGLLLAIAAGATYAATTILGHRLASRTDPVVIATCTTTAGAVALAPLFLVASLNGEPVVPSDPTSLGLLVYLGVFTLALSYGLLYAGLRTTSGAAATVVTLVEPISAAVLAAVLLGQQLTWMSVVGAILILGAVVGLPAGRDVPDGRPDPGV